MIIANHETHVIHEAYKVTTKCNAVDDGMGTVQLLKDQDKELLLAQEYTLCKHCWLEDGARNN